MEENPHHLVLGKLTDFLTGNQIVDTHDERYRQKILKHLILNCGFAKADIRKGQDIIVSVDDWSGRVKVDFLIELEGKICMLIKYAPGSLVTRRMSNLALSRITRPYQIPWIVTTNGEDAEIINGNNGGVVGSGIKSIPCKKDMLSLNISDSYPKVSSDLHEKASRIAYACEVDGACPCDTDVCVINAPSSE